MAKFTILLAPVNAAPKNFPVNRLNKLKDKLKRHLVRDVAPMLIKDMRATTQNWNTAPTFVYRYSEPYGTRLQLEVFPTGKGTLNWKRVSEGTGPRIIRARTPKGMRFRRKYSPKTTPGGRYGGSGRRSGQWVTAFSVDHSIEPRKFTVRIMRRREDKLRKDIQRIVHKVAK